MIIRSSSTSNPTFPFLMLRPARLMWPISIRISTRLLRVTRLTYSELTQEFSSSITRARVGALSLLMLTNNLARQFINPKTNTMKKLSRLLLRPALITCIAAGIISCGKDDPAPRITVAFSGTSMTVSENDGTISVGVELNQPYGKDLNIEYSVSGTASDQDNVGTAAADFQIEGTHGVVSIPAGSTEGTINITIMNDNIYEENETIVLRIIDASTGDVQMGDASEFVITITRDDPQLTASFAAATMPVNEDDDFEGLIHVVVQLDKPAPTDLKRSYTSDG